MLRDVLEARPCGGHRLWLRFEGGAEGEVDLAPVLTFTGVLAPLEDAGYFASVRVNPELGTVCWPNGADLDPVVLWALVTGQPVPRYGHAPVASNF